MPTTAVTIEFQDADFVGNNYCDNYDCALCRAIRRHAAKEVTAGGHYFRFVEDCERQYPIPKQVNDAINERYDNPKAPLPMPFTIELPTNILK